MVQTAKTILVTGAASGMGKSTVDLFIDAGWKVIGLDLTAAETEPTPGAEIINLKVDVRDKQAIDEALKSALAPDQKINAVANIAGIYPPTNLENYTEETYRKIFDINVLGVVNVVAAASPYLTEGSAVINFSSVDAFQVSPGQLFYGASKAAVVMLTKAMALELAPRGIRVNGIAPGWVKTPGNEATGRMKEVLPTIPLQKVADPVDIAEWVMLLASEKYNSFLTGETVTLSGGAVIRH